MNLIDKLHAQRVRLGLTQQSVAQAMGTTQSALSRAESDGNPTQDFLQRYRAALVELGKRKGVDGVDAQAMDAYDAAALRAVAEHLTHALSDAGVASSGDVLRQNRVRFNSLILEITLAGRAVDDVPRSARNEVMGAENQKVLEDLVNQCSRRYDTIDAMTLHTTVLERVPELLDALRPYVDAPAE